MKVNADRPARGSTREDARLARSIETWFEEAARDLPWRVTPRDPYRSLVSEFMLQQTQVSRVLEKFEPFLKAFPSIEILANAHEDRVLAAWSGLGYYRRARLLHAAAKAVVQRHEARVPDSLDSLSQLPGVGRYTAGAMASITFGRSTPIVDGNVARVLLRIHGRKQSTAEAQDWLWDRAASLVSCARSPARFNEGLMELGALVCTPKAPRCLHCPVRSICQAFASGDPERIPLPKARTAQKPLFCEVLLCRDAKGRILVEQRTFVGKGLWAGMWQAPTLESPTRLRDAAAIASLLHWPADAMLKRLETFEHSTTHRQVWFRVWEVPRKLGLSLRDERPGSRLCTHAEIARLALSNPQRRILLGDA